MTDDQTPTAPERPITQTREFWPLMVFALGLGVFGALFSLVFMFVIHEGGRWYSVSDPGWWGGHWWWVGVTAGAGVLVGMLRNWTKLPIRLPSLIEDLQSEHLETSVVPGVLVVSAISLMGGASLGPELALGNAGGGAAGWIARRRGLDTEDSQVNTLAGFSGAYGGLFSSHGHRGDVDPGGREPRWDTVPQGAPRDDHRRNRLARDLLRGRRRGVRGSLRRSRIRLSRLG